MNIDSNLSRSHWLVRQRFRKEKNLQKRNRFAMCAMHATSDPVAQSGDYREASGAASRKSEL